MSFAVGANALPVTFASVENTRAFPDVAADILLGLFTQAIISETSAAWATVAQDTELVGRAAVEDLFIAKPTKELMLERKASFPGLYLCRDDKARVEEYAIDSWVRRQSWALYYVVGQLDAAAAHKFEALLSGIVPNVIAQCLRRKGHPDYASGVLVIGEQGVSGISAAQTTESAHFILGDADTGRLHGSLVTFETLELLTDVPLTSVPFNSVLLTLDLDAGSEDPVEEFIEADTSEPPYP